MNPDGNKNAKSEKRKEKREKNLVKIRDNRFKKFIYSGTSLNVWV